MKTENQEKFKKDWHFASKDDELIGIQTAIYENGNQVKSFDLSDGKKAVVRELFGRDIMQIDKLIAGENNPDLRQDKYILALFHYAVKIDGKQIPMEEFENLKGKDYNRIKASAQSLNF